MRRKPFVLTGLLTFTRNGARLETLDSPSGIWNLSWLPSEWMGKEVRVTVELVKGKRA